MNVLVVSYLLYVIYRKILRNWFCSLQFVCARTVLFVNCLGHSRYFAVVGQGVHLVMPSAMQGSLLVVASGVFVAIVCHFIHF